MLLIASFLLCENDPLTLSIPPVPTNPTPTLSTPTLIPTPTIETPTLISTPTPTPTMTPTPSPTPTPTQDTTPPSLIKPLCVPYNQEVDVDLNLSEINLVFNEPVKANDSNYAALINETINNGYIDLPIHFTARDTITLTLPPAILPLKGAESYCVSIINITDVYGNKMNKSQNIQFITHEAIPPHLKSDHCVPADNSVDVSIRLTEILFAFDENIQNKDGKAVVQMTGGTGTISIASIQDNILKLKLSGGNLDGSTVYTITINGVKDKYGNMMTIPASIHFTTHEAIPPHLVKSSCIPFHLDNNVSIHLKQMELMFDEEIQNNNSNAEFSLSPGTANVSFSNISGMKVILNVMDGPLEANTIYTVSVSGIEDRYNNPMAAADSISFTTSSLSYFSLEKLSPSGDPSVSTTFTIRITAKDIWNGTFADYSGHIMLSTVSGTGNLTGNISNITLINGTADVDLQYDKSEAIQIHGEDENSYTSSPDLGLNIQ